MGLGFKDAVEIILSHEGGYVWDVKDPGGETNYGISKRAYPDLDIASLDRNEAISIYYRDYWLPLKCDKLPFGVALVLFDMGVNMGKSQAVKLLQRAVLVKPDGIMGGMTSAAVSAHHKNVVIEKTTQERILFYAGLPTFERFGKGWVRRSIETMSSALLIRDAV
jgi:lysozyme family protein